MDQEKIGRFIAETRNQAGMTQKELAGKIGISDKTISKWNVARACLILHILRHCVILSQ